MKPAHTLTLLGILATSLIAQPVEFISDTAANGLRDADTGTNWITLVVYYPSETDRSPEQELGYEFLPKNEYVTNTTSKVFEVTNHVDMGAVAGVGTFVFQHKFRFEKAYFPGGVFTPGDVVTISFQARVTSGSIAETSMIARFDGWRGDSVAVDLEGDTAITNIPKNFVFTGTVPENAGTTYLEFGVEMVSDDSAGEPGLATVRIENLTGTVEPAPEIEMWKGFEVLSGADDGWVDTGTENMGWVFMRNDPFLFSLSLNSWFYMDASTDFAGSGMWIYAFRD